MEIRHKTHNLFRDSHVRKAAEAAHCYANVKWSDPFSVRFTLHADGPGSAPADEVAHDEVIRQLLMLDPDATVRTARAIYEGWEDFIGQRGSQYVVHHINGDPRDNSRANLRLVHRGENRSTG